MGKEDILKARKAKKEQKKAAKIKENKWRTLRPVQEKWRKRIAGIKKDKKPPKEYTFKTNFNLARRVQVQTYKKRARRCIYEIKRYVRKRWKVREVKINPSLNKYFFSNGRKNPPRKVRLVVSRRKREDEDEDNKRKDKFYCDVTHEVTTNWSQAPERAEDPNVEKEDEEMEDEGDEEEEGETEEKKDVEMKETKVEEKK